MSRRNRARPTPTPTAFEQARDEMFYHVIHCGVIESDPVHHDEWFEETMRYLADRYPELDDEQLNELRTVGERFARPAKARQEADTAA
jgi:hypothetical protein